MLFTSWKVLLEKYFPKVSDPLYGRPREYIFPVRTDLNSK